MDAAVLSPRLRELIARLSPRAGPLIITVFGDSIVPRGGNIWLGSLIALMAPLGLSERLVRTGVYRLTRDHWLTARGRGRRSYYELTASARQAFAEAERRIYVSEPPRWDGDWLLVQMHDGFSTAHRQALRKSLHWLGFGQLSPTLFVRPGGREPLLSKHMEDAHAAGLVSVFTAKLLPVEGAADARATAEAAWDIDELNSAYGSFVAAFKRFASSPPRDDVGAFVVRTLLIHEYRRVLLQDPQLPADLLTRRWAGARARRMAAGLYLAVHPLAEQFVAAHMQCWDGRPAEPGREYLQRFASAAP